MEDLTFDEKVNLLVDLITKACSNLEYREECHFENFNQKLFEIYFFIKDYKDVYKKYNEYNFENSLYNERLNNLINEFPEYKGNEKSLKLK